MIPTAILASVASLCSGASGACASHVAAARLLTQRPSHAKYGPSNIVIAPEIVSSNVRPAQADTPALARINSANSAAMQEPARGSYLGAVQVYAWTEGGLYRLYTAPERVSDIALEPGEMLVSVAAGDTARWIIGDTSSGTGAERRTHILVKPLALGLRTNLVIATSRRVYHIELESSSKAAMWSISWTYPEDPLLALKGAAATDVSVTPDVTVDALNFDYRIEGDRPPWRPIRVFDDGQQVFIEFPPAISEVEAPPLFVTGEGGRAELVNYRMRGRYYVVDRMFGTAELRLGERRQQIVRIIREHPISGHGRNAS